MLFLAFLLHNCVQIHSIFPENNWEAEKWGFCRGSMNLQFQMPLQAFSSVQESQRDMLKMSIIKEEQKLESKLKLNLHSCLCGCLTEYWFILNMISHL